jgi:hypothetical protein
VRIAILVEGKTEKAFKPHLRAFLETRLAGRMPRLDVLPYDGRIPKAGKLKRIVERLLNDPRRPADAVIALTDVYTGTQPPDFLDAADAKGKMRQWVGETAGFHPHAAQYEFEAWLLPNWDEIRNLSGSNRNAPSGAPERVNHHHPPSRHIKEAFRTGSKGRAYVKARNAARILRGKDLLVAAAKCPELKAFLNTMLDLSGRELIW